MKTVLCILAITHSLCLSANYWTDTLENRLSLSITPHHLLELYHGPSANLGVEYKIKENFSAYSEFGYYLENVNWSDYLNLSGFSLAQEVKLFYFDQAYVAFQIIYGRQHYWRIDSIPGGQTLFNENKKQFLDLSIRFGKNFLFKDRLLIIPYGGLGIRTHKLRSSLTANEANNRLLGDWNNPKNWIHKYGNKTYLKAQVGLRLGYRIN